MNSRKTSSLFVEYFFPFSPGKSKPFILSSCWRTGIGRSSSRSHNLGPPVQAIFFCSNLFFFSQGGNRTVVNQVPISSRSRIQAVSLETVGTAEDRTVLNRLPTSRSRIQEPIRCLQLCEQRKNRVPTSRSSMGSQLLGPESKSYSFPPSVPNR